MSLTNSPIRITVRRVSSFTATVSVIAQQNPVYTSLSVNYGHRYASTISLTREFFRKDEKEVLAQSWKGFYGTMMLERVILVIVYTTHISINNREVTQEQRSSSKQLHHSVWLTISSDLSIGIVKAEGGAASSGARETDAAFANEKLWKREREKERRTQKERLVRYIQYTGRVSNIESLDSMHRSHVFRVD